MRKHGTLLRRRGIDPLSEGPGDPASAKGPSRFFTGAIIGVVTAATALGVGHLTAGFVDPQATPLVVVGQASIDLTPEWLKSLAIETFGENDKLVLLLGMGVVLVAASAALGIGAVRRRWVGIAGLACFGAVGVAAALTRPAARWTHVLPVIVGVTAGAGAMLVLVRSATGALRSRPRSRVQKDGGERYDLDRRRLLLTTTAGAALAALSGGAGALLARRFRADDSRATVRIPRPASTAAAASGDVELDVAGLGPFFTPNGRFYRVDTALLVPSVMAEDWRLRIHGMVERKITIDYDQLLSRPLIERDITLTCVSNPVGGHYVGNARWIGVSLVELLDEVGVQPGADQIVTRSVDGFTVGTPTAVATDGRDAMLAVAMNGEPLPLEHGFPVRMIVPGLYGYVSATKWLVDVELTTFDAFDPYWIERGWANRAPIKTMSRIDTPSSFVRVPAGEVPVAGVAWAQRSGIDRVELQIDEGRFVVAELAGEDTVDTWRQWVYRWNAPVGEHRLRVRATDRSGLTQPEDRAEPFPDGATGWHTILVEVI